MKKNVSLFAVVVIMMLAVLPVFASATEITSVKTDLPAVSAVVCVPDGTGKDIDAKAIKASLGGTQLKAENVKVISPAVEWVVMIDSTLSLSRTHFDAEKKSVVSLLNSLDDNDTLVLYYFEDKLTKVLDGTEDKAEAEKKINALKCNGQETVFYDALAKMVEESKNTKADVCVPVIFSDGVDTKSKTSKEDIIKKMKSSDVEIFGLYPDVLGKTEADAFNSILKNSGGNASSFNADNINKKIKSLNVAEKNETVNIDFTATSAIKAGESSEIVIDLGNNNVVKSVVKTKAWEPETSAQETTVKQTTEASETTVETTVEAAAETTEAVVDETTTDQTEPDGNGSQITEIAVKYGPIAAAVIVVAALVVFLLKKRAKNKPEKDEKPVISDTPVTNLAEEKKSFENAAADFKDDIDEVIDDGKPSKKNKKTKEKEPEKPQFQFYFEDSSAKKKKKNKEE